MKNKYCFFCDICEERKGIIYENRFWFARFDLFPTTPGHAEIVLKRHVVSLLELNDKEWAALRPAIDGTIKVIKLTDLRLVYSGFINNPFNENSKDFCQQMFSHIGIDRALDGYNWGINEGEAAGRTIHHVHFHIIPRFFGDVPNPGGECGILFPEEEVIRINYVTREK